MISLTIEKSQIELISGIPEYIIFLTDVPSTVFYTLDGTVPDADSLVADGRVYLPSNQGSVVLTAVAISDDDNSDLIVEEFSTIMKINKVQHTGYEGIRILPANGEPILNLGYDENGEASQQSSIVLEELDVVASRTDYTGMPILGENDGKTSKEFINLIKDKTKYSHPYKSSPNNNNVFFDPKAKYIEIDGTTSAAMEGQIVKIVNRPYGNFDPVSKGYNEGKKQSENVITGNLVRSIYDPFTGLYVSFYYESKDSRWIVSKQRTDKKILTINFNSEKNRFVFRWVEDRHMTRIF
jgi:hypothetical protein